MEDFGFFLQTLEDLVSIASVSQNEESVAKYIYQLLSQLGFSPRLQAVGNNSANVIAEIPGGNGPTYLLGGHIDTVEICKGWQRDPMRLTVEGNKAYGLGACDMKGGIAALLTLLRRISQGECCPAGNVLFAALADEERYSLGAEVFGQGMPKADFCILAEPHYEEFVIGATGKILLRLTVRGVSGHAAKPESGVNAIDCASRFITALNRKYGEMYREGVVASHCILRIWSDYTGYSLNIPDCCHILLNKQLYISEDAVEFQKTLNEIFSQECPDATLSIEKEIPYYPAYRTDLNNPHFIKLRRIAESVTGLSVPCTINQSVTDGNIIEPVLHIPTVVFGPKGYGCHKPDEYLDLESVPYYLDILQKFIS